MLSPFATGVNVRASHAAGYRGPAEGPVSMTHLRTDIELRQLVGSYKAFTLALYEDDTMSAVGGGVNGELAQGNHRNQSLPVAVALPPIAEVDADGAHWIARLVDGRVATCGGNSWGTKGDGTTGFGQEKAGTAIPYIVPGITDAVEVATGGGLCAVRHSDGTVSVWGAGGTGGLGDGKVYNPLKDAAGTKPQKVPGLTGVERIAVGGFGPVVHAIALVNGVPLQWGAHGPCGTAHDLLKPEALALSNIEHVAAGAGQSFAIGDQNELNAWGSNHDGQLWLPEAIASVRSSEPHLVREGVATASAGFQFSMCIDTDLTVDAVGRNDLHQCGLDNMTGASYIFAAMEVAYAIADTAPIPPPIAATPTAGGAAVSWSLAPHADTKPWLVDQRPMDSGKVFGNPQKLPAGTRGTKIIAPTGEATEIRVRNPAFGQRFAEVIPA